ncbi:universal stress protein [Halalkalicoccus jeotgali]|uniref:UspA domain protein n=1 Tax=Halalkalicoccus jeotgali (strain DSM 18796 / CECT 7217 / JCM 14584 / KCTC 4019 / B3) TaxID=795797 RepID=D8J987_HALJB|nr:universal stress protein [Halalkalicoccus jeotgali]ADJ16356.1 UspA domain protein [Halalkalicoccus jeotgali B3]ELY37090.1 UspA domain-containing protein [Halalkalicoccus jeotgali B3]
MSEPLFVETVLVPVDGSDESVTAIEYAVEIAEKYDAAVHVVYVLGEELVRGIETDTVDREAVASEAEAFAEAASETAAGTGVEVTSSSAYGFSRTQKTRHPGSAVLDCAEEVDADFLVIPREPSTDGPGDVLERAAEYVLLYASQPVLST